MIEVYGALMLLFLTVSFRLLSQADNELRQYEEREP